jgi:quercetin dioxygenase-like cupin family protein
MSANGFVRPAGSGPTYDWRGARVAVKASGADTLGQVAVLEFGYPAGLVVPSHVHDGEDEMFSILSGRLAGFCGDDEWIVAAGDFVFVPRDRPHGFTVLDGVPAAALVVVGPPRLDQQVAASGVRVTDSAGPGAAGRVGG